VDRNTFGDQLVPLPAGEAEAEVRLHFWGQMPAPGKRPEVCLDPAVQISGGQVKDAHRILSATDM
jgi:hypothetical protein